MSVQVQDSVTGAWIAAGAKLVARSGTYADSMSYAAGDPIFNAEALFGAYEHAGVFTVTVTKVGYESWVKSNVLVTADECHVNTTQLTARLKPLP